MGTFSWGSIFQYRLELLAIFSNLDFNSKFTLKILVIGMVDDINVEYALLREYMWIKNGVRKWGCTG